MPEKLENQLFWDHCKMIVVRNLSDINSKALAVLLQLPQFSSWYSDSKKVEIGFDSWNHSYVRLFIFSSNASW